jgi:hypothetical protein
MTNSISSPLVFSFSPQQQEALPTLASTGRRREGPLSTTARKAWSFVLLLVPRGLQLYPVICTKIPPKMQKCRVEKYGNPEIFAPQILRVKKFVHFTIISASLLHPSVYSAAKRHSKNFRPFFSKNKVILKLPGFLVLCEGKGGGGKVLFKLKVLT